jgi:succinyl-CoA synthetase beta subunit
MLILFYLILFKVTKQCVRGLMLHEHHGVRLLQKARINVPPFGVAKSADEAFEQAQKIGDKNYVVKAQVLAGGRGKG